jgi:hypothetical protein
MHIYIYCETTARSKCLHVPSCILRISRSNHVCSEAGVRLREVVEGCGSGLRHSVAVLTPGVVGGENRREPQGGRWIPAGQVLG